jgi:hypothetical protein
MPKLQTDLKFKAQALKIEENLKWSWLCEKL